MEICALVLAGGKSTRMNGNNKAFLKYKDKTFIENIISELDIFDKIYISVDSKEKYKDLNYELIEDEFQEIGPIGGIYSALKTIKQDYVFVIACDMPKIKKNLIEVLINSIEPEDKCVVFKDDEGRVYPLGGIYSKKSLPIIKEMIDNENYKLQNLVKRLDGKVLSISEYNLDHELFINVNNPEEYKNLNK
ncbi:MAG TPA: molybdenum cofactor guanylyltransferase [Clostridium sp.]|nr:molybdenum cofactor guanylyltransferase [Clostridium sp.]